MIKYITDQNLGYITEYDRFSLPFKELSKRDIATYFIYREREWIKDRSAMAVMVFEGKESDRFMDTAHIVQYLSKKPETTEWIDFLDSELKNHRRIPKEGFHKYIALDQRNIKHIARYATNINFIYAGSLSASVDGFSRMNDVNLEHYFKFPKEHPELAPFWAFASESFFNFSEELLKHFEGNEEDVETFCGNAFVDLSYKYEDLITGLRKKKMDIAEAEAEMTKEINSSRITLVN